MGNQLIKDYDIDKEQVCEGGACGLWKIYNGKKQDNTKRLVSIFIFDKSKASKIKKSREDVYTFLKREP